MTLSEEKKKMKKLDEQVEIGPGAYVCYVCNDSGISIWFDQIPNSSKTISWWGNQQQTYGRGCCFLCSQLFLFYLFIYVFIFLIDEGNQ